MTKPIEKLPDGEIESPADAVMHRKINEIIDRTNENTRLIEAMPDFPMLPTGDTDEQC